MKDSNSQRVAKNTLYLFIRMVLVTLVSLYTSRVVLKVLGFDDFAIYSVVGSVVVFFSFFKTALNNATYRYIAYELGTRNAENLKKVYSMAINCHVLLSLLFFFLLEVGGVWFLNNKLVIDPERLYAANWCFQFSVLSFCVDIVRTPFNSNIIAHEEMNYYAFISIVEVLLKLAIVFLLLWSQFDKLVTYGALHAAVTLIITLCYVIYCNWKFKDCTYYRYWNKDLLVKFSSYSGWSLIVNVADVTTVQSISIFFFNILGTIASASLGIANQVVNALNQFLHTFTQAFNPQIIKNYAAGKYDTFMKMIFTTSKISYYLLFLLALPIIVNIKFVLRLWLGDYPPFAPSFIQMIIIYSLVDAFQAPLWQAVHATGNIKTHQILMSSIKITAIPLMYLALKNGCSGSFALAIWASLNIICAIVRTIYLKSLIGLDIKEYVNKVVLRIILITILSLPLPIYITTCVHNEWSSFLLSSIVAVFFVLSISFLWGLTSEEKRILYSMPIVCKWFKDKSA